MLAASVRNTLRQLCWAAPHSLLGEQAGFPTSASWWVKNQPAENDPQREAELAKLLASGVVTQAAINYAGLCDGGQRGGSCSPPTPRPRCPAVLSATPSAPPPQLRPLSRRCRGRVRRRALPPRPARCDRGGHMRAKIRLGRCTVSYPYRAPIVRRNVQ